MAMNLRRMLVMAVRIPGTLKSACRRSEKSATKGALFNCYTRCSAKNGSINLMDLYAKRKAMALTPAKCDFKWGIANGLGTCIYCTAGICRSQLPELQPPLASFRKQDSWTVPPTHHMEHTSRRTEHKSKRHKSQLCLEIRSRY